MSVQAAAVRPHHVLAAAGLALLVALVLVWSTRSASYPDPRQRAMPVDAIGDKAASDRKASVLRFSLACLDTLTRGAPKDAVHFCDLALALDPQSVTLLNLRGNALVLAGEPKKALADFSRAIELDPANPEAYRYRGNVEFTLHQDEAALADYDQAVRIDPTNSVGIELRGHFYQAQGRYDLAVADFSRAIALNPSGARAWNSRCWTRVLANREVEKALADCDRAIALNPNYPSAYDSRGYAHVRLTQYGEAIADFSTALAMEPHLASSLFGRGLAKLQTGDKSAARDLAQARLLDRGIEQRFANMGFRLKANGASGS